MAGEKSEILQGTLDLMLLQTFASRGPLHGYAIARRIELVCEEALQINQGAMNASPVRLVIKRWISGPWGTSGNNRKATFNSITKTWRKQLNAEVQNWECISGVIGRVRRIAEQG